nr:YadA-like family protein [Variovorax sp. SG517]
MADVVVGDTSAECVNPSNLTGPSTISVNIGCRVNTSGGSGGQTSVGIGYDVVATGHQSVAIGAGAASPTFYGIAIGAGAQAIGYPSYGSIAIGWGAISSNAYSVALGTNAEAAGAGAFAGGLGAKATAHWSTAIGTYSQAIGLYSTAVGYSAAVGGDNAVAIGQSYAGGAGSTSIGWQNSVTGARSTAVGVGNQVTGTGSGAFGDPNNISGDGSYSVGNNNTVTGNNSFVLGNNVTVTNANNVVLGNNSADKAAAQVSSATVAGVVATLNPDGTVTYSAGPAITYSGFAGTASGVVSVGAVGAERQIVNVAPGAINATSTDAINGSQLYSVASAVNALGGNITTIVNNASSHFYSVNGGVSTDGNYANNGATAVGAIASGINASASAANSVAVGTNASASTANSVALGADSNTTAATPTASATIQGQTYNFAGANPVGVVSVGGAGAERQIQNVAAGQLSATSTDAVNGSQLYATNQAINNIQTGGGIKYFHANSAAADSQALGAESVAIGPQAVSQGAGSIAVGNSSLATAANGVALGAGATADRAGMAGGQELFSNAVVGSTQGAVSVGSAGNERQITNVAGGTQATDAVNVRQLQAVKNSSVQYQTNADGSVDYQNVTLGQSSGPTTIHNVAPGVAGNDAVNVKQLNEASAASAAYTDSRANQLRGDIRATAKDASAGTAGAMAMAGMPQAYIPGKSMLAAGVAGYDGQAALAIGISKLSDNGRWIVKFSGSANSRGKVGVSAGAGFHW